MKNRACLILFIVVLFFIPDVVDSIAKAVAPYKFNIASWEFRHFWNEQKEPLDGNYCLGLDGELYDPSKAHLLAISEAEENMFLKYVLSETIRDSGFDNIFPPLSFSIESAPNLLVISPRHQILLEETRLLIPAINIAEILALEKDLEQLTGKSVLIVKLGGLALYPSIIDDDSNVITTLTTAAHEWIHHRLILTPLGRRYFGEQFMRELNENVAQLVGNELGLKAVARIPKCINNQFELTKPIDVTQHREFLGMIRTEVEIMLAGGLIDKAEKYMGQQRNNLAESGYSIRRLNQAYYAFHGMYGDDPVSSSGIYPRLQMMRNISPDLYSFLSLIGGVKKEEDFHILTNNY